jgi:hypothetical protein
MTAFITTTLHTWHLSSLKHIMPDSFHHHTTTETESIHPHHTSHITAFITPHFTHDSFHHYNASHMTEFTTTIPHTNSFITITHQT